MNLIDTDMNRIDCLGEELDDEVIDVLHDAVVRKACKQSVIAQIKRARMLGRGIGFCQLGLELLHRLVEQG